ncbi:alpha/beta fold hydrolase [Streptomyces sannanensis]|uniref:Alpha/beta fold hydrolase n=1 Tax=Streptomyces sannanensis TaxID=285536 RepID=A0ABP6SF16_9ACTN
MQTSPAGRVLVLTAVAVLLPFAACSGNGGGTTAKESTRNFAAQQLNWEKCPPPSPAAGGGSAPAPLPGGTEWQCATMEVPRDYAKPNGETIELALIRAPARDQSRRIGSLLFNFGGPGGSGTSTLPAAVKDYESLRSRYDLVSFDPRGVGDSDDVQCESNKQLDAYYAQNAIPDTPREEKTYTDNLKDYAAACKKNSDGLLPYVGTANAARDMDLMRQVLGDAKLHYFGISYGTELGGVYAHLFPDKVGRAVLDGAVDPTEDAEQSALGQTRGFQLAMDNFAQDCVNRGDLCLLRGSTRQEVEAGIAALLKKLDRKPVPGIGDRQLTATQAINGIAQALYSKEFWPLLEQGIDEAEGGNGALLLALSDALNGRSENGMYNNLQAANAAINCVDSKQRYSLQQTKAALPRFREASPIFGDYLGWALMTCTHWPVPGQWTTPDVSAPGAPPIVVVGTTGDPATPYGGALKLAEELGKGVGRVVTYEGEGHAAYNSGNKCVKTAVDAYLLNGKVPAEGTTCK